MNQNAIEIFGKNIIWFIKIQKTSLKKIIKLKRQHIGY